MSIGCHMYHISKFFKDDQRAPLRFTAYSPGSSLSACNTGSYPLTQMENILFWYVCSTVAHWALEKTDAPPQVNKMSILPKISDGVWKRTISVFKSMLRNTSLLLQRLYNLQKCIFLFRTIKSREETFSWISTHHISSISSIQRKPEKRKARKQSNRAVWWRLKTQTAPLLFI